MQFTSIFALITLVTAATATPLSKSASLSSNQSVAASSGQSGGTSSDAEQMICIVNLLRKSQSLKPVKYYDSFVKLAQTQSNFMARIGELKTTNQYGERANVWLENSGYYNPGERNEDWGLNVGTNANSVEQVVNQWLSNQAGYDNIFSPHFVQAGGAVGTDKGNGNKYYTYLAAYKSGNNGGYIPECQGNYNIQALLQTKPGTSLANTNGNVAILTDSSAGANSQPASSGANTATGNLSTSNNDAASANNENNSDSSIN